MQIFSCFVFQPQLNVFGCVGRLRQQRAPRGRTNDCKMNAGVLKSFTQDFMFDIILAQTLTCHGMLPGGKELGAGPNPWDKSFAHTLFRLPFDDFIDRNRIIGIDPEGFKKDLYPGAAT